MMVRSLLPRAGALVAMTTLRFYGLLRSRLDSGLRDFRVRPEHLRLFPEE